MSSMSFLGAMAGLGQGMQHYSTLLGEKRKRDWEEQAQIAKDQRYQNLLKLQNDWTAKREEDRDLRGHTNRLSELEAGRVSALTQAEELHTLGNRLKKVDANDPDLQAIEEAEYQKGLGRRVGEARTTNEINLEAFEAQARKQAAISSELDEGKKKEFWNAVNKQPWFQELSQDQQQVLYISNFFPELATNFADEKIPAEVQKELVPIYQGAVETGVERFAKLPVDQKKELKVAADKVGTTAAELYGQLEGVRALEAAKSAFGYGNKKMSNDNPTKVRNKTISQLKSGEIDADYLRGINVAEDVIQQMHVDAKLPYSPPPIKTTPPPEMRGQRPATPPTAQPSVLQNSVRPSGQAPSAYQPPAQGDIGAARTGYNNLQDRFQSLRQGN